MQACGGKTDLHFDLDGVQPGEVEGRIPWQDVERSTGKAAFTQRFPVDADVHGGDRCLREGQDPVTGKEKKKSTHISLRLSVKADKRMHKTVLDCAQLPDVCGSPYPTQRLHSRVEVLGILGVGDEHCRPLLELEVREAEHVVVQGQNSVPAGETGPSRGENSGRFRRWFKISAQT